MRNDLFAIKQAHLYGGINSCNRHDCLSKLMGLENESAINQYRAPARALVAMASFRFPVWLSRVFTSDHNPCESGEAIE